MAKTKEELNAITEDIVREVKDTLQDKVYKIILFGSYARGDYDDGSDIDVMVLSDTDLSTIKQYRKPIHKAASRLSLKNDLEVSLLIRDKESFEANSNDYPFYRAINEEGVQIYG